MDVLDIYVDAVLKDGAGTHAETEHAPRRETAGTEPVRPTVAEQPAATSHTPSPCPCPLLDTGWSGNRTSIWRPPLSWAFALRVAPSAATIA